MDRPPIASASAARARTSSSRWRAPGRRDSRGCDTVCAPIETPRSRPAAAAPRDVAGDRGRRPPAGRPAARNPLRLRDGRRARAGARTRRRRAGDPTSHERARPTGRDPNGSVAVADAGIATSSAAAIGRAAWRVSAYPSSNVIATVPSSIAPSRAPPPGRERRPPAPQPQGAPAAAGTCRDVPPDRAGRDRRSRSGGTSGRGRAVADGGRGGPERAAPAGRPRVTTLAPPARRRAPGSADRGGAARLVRSSSAASPVRKSIREDVPEGHHLDVAGPNTSPKRRRAEAPVSLQ